jgi:hypothetical protein
MPEHNRAVRQPTMHSCGHALHATGVSTSKRYVFPESFRNFGLVKAALALHINRICVLTPASNTKFPLNFNENIIKVRRKTALTTGSDLL